MVVVDTVDVVWGTEEDVDVVDVVVVVGGRVLDVVVVLVVVVVGRLEGVVVLEEEEVLVEFSTEVVV